jgi:hypothetical protein
MEPTDSRPARPHVCYSQETADRICELVEAGLSLKTLEARGVAPTRGTLADWRRRHPDFAEALAAAKTKGGEARHGGRPTDYSDALAEWICADLAKGRPLSAICAEPGLPAEDTVQAWIGWYPDFAAMVATARELHALLLGEEILAIADAANAQTLALAKTRIAARQWMAATLAPKKARPEAARREERPPPIVEFANFDDIEEA